MNTECYEAVREFHVRYGQPVYAGRVTEAVRLLRFRLLFEELAEVVVAWHEDDLVGVADGLADLLYVTFGAAVSCLDVDLGLPCDPWSYAPPKFGKLEGKLDRLAYDVADLGGLIMTGHATGALRHRLHTVAVTVNEVARVKGIPLRACFLEVHRSNMTKDVVELRDGQKGGVKGSSYSPPDLRPLLKVTP